MRAQLDNARPPGHAVTEVRVDERELEAFRRGDRVLLRKWYDAHVKDVYLVVSRGFRLKSGGDVPGLSDAASREDVVQETFIRAFSATARANYAGDVPFVFYLRQIARNLLVDRARKHNRDVKLAATLSLSEADVEALNPETQVDTQQQQVRVRQFVGALDEECRAVFDARFQRGLSERDAAEHLRVTRRRIRTVHTRILEQFKAFLSPN